MKTAVKKARTETGLKDTFQLHFIEKLFESVKKKRVAHTQEAALLAARKTLPSWLDGNEDPTKLLSPVWRMKGLLCSVVCHTHNTDILLERIGPPHRYTC